MTISQSDLYSLALQAGLPADRARVAAAIAMAESGGDPNQHNNNAATGDNSYGLWQINMLGAMGPDRIRQFGITSNNDLFNPATNAHAMAILSKNGADFNDWSAFKSGSYLHFMNNTVTDNSKKPGWLSTIVNGALGGLIPGYGAVSGVAGATVGGVYDSTQGSIQAIGEATSKTAHWVSNADNWLRVAYVVGGGVLLIIALGRLVEGTQVGKAVTAVTTKGIV